MTDKQSLEELIEEFETNTGRKPSIPAYIAAGFLTLVILISLLSWFGVLLVAPIYLIEIMLQ